MQNLSKKLRIHSDVLNRLIWKYLSSSALCTVMWNYYLQFTEHWVRKNTKYLKKLTSKLVKDFIEVIQNLEIKKDLKNKNSI